MWECKKEEEPHHPHTIAGTIVTRLNVAADNTTATRCKQRLGFQIIARYERCCVQSQDR